MCAWGAPPLFSGLCVHLCVHLSAHTVWLHYNVLLLSASAISLVISLVVSLVISETISLVVSVAVSSAAACSVLYGAYTISLCELSAMLLAAVTTAVVSAIVTSIVTSAVTSIAAASTVCYGNTLYARTSNTLSLPLTILNTNILQPKSNNI